MKHLISWFWVLALVCVVLLATTPLLAEEWSAEQKAVSNVVKAYCAACQGGDMNEIMAFFHPKFTYWDYTQQLPANLGALRKMTDDFLKTYKLIKFEATPVEIQVEGNVAIVHANYEETFKDSSGKEITNSGPTTITLLKKANKWLFLG